MGIHEGGAAALIRSRKVAEFFDEAAKGLQTPQLAAAFIVGQMFSRYSTATQRDEWETPVTPSRLHELCVMVESGRCNRGLAKTTFEKMMDTGKGATAFLSADDLAEIDNNQLKKICQEVLAENVSAVQSYLGGKETALKALVGAVMRKTRGRANAAKAEQLLVDSLKKG
ncbi:MAG: hypothetical protein V8T62_03765 [Oscillospiraceae bacterium]